MILGVAAGYLKPEFAALGVDFDERNELTDEAIDVIRGVLTTTERVEHEGRHFRSRGTTMRPRPATRLPADLDRRQQPRRDPARGRAGRRLGAVPEPGAAARARCERRCSTASTSSPDGSTSCATYADSDRAGPAPTRRVLPPVLAHRSVRRRVQSARKIAQLERSRRDLVRPQRAVRTRPGASISTAPERFAADVMAPTS